jgi:hypothetical protein
MSSLHVAVEIIPMNETYLPIERFASKYLVSEVNPPVRGE